MVLFVRRAAPVLLVYHSSLGAAKDILMALSVRKVDLVKLVCHRSPAAEEGFRTAHSSAYKPEATNDGSVGFASYLVGAHSSFVRDIHGSHSRIRGMHTSCVRTSGSPDTLASTLRRACNIGILVSTLGKMIAVRQDMAGHCSQA